MCDNFSDSSVSTNNNKSHLHWQISLLRVSFKIGGKMTRYPKERLGPRLELFNETIWFRVGTRPSPYRFWGVDTMEPREERERAT